MQWETLKIEGEGAIRHLVLTRPEKHNAVNLQLLTELIAACGVLDADRDCRAVILRGEGKSFCSGADLKESITDSASTRDLLERAQMGSRAIMALVDMAPVTIAAMHGHAIGGGACFGAACDFRIAAESARVSVRESSLGLSLSWHSIPNFVHLVGSARAKEMIMFGDSYAPQTLLTYGYFGEVVPDDQLLAAAGRLAERVAAQPPLPVRMTKASINALVKALDRSVFHMDSHGLALTASSQDSRKAREAFFQGETPQWRGE